MPPSVSTCDERGCPQDTWPAYDASADEIKEKEAEGQPAALAQDELALAAAAAAKSTATTNAKTNDGSEEASVDAAPVAVAAGGDGGVASELADSTATTESSPAAAEATGTDVEIADASIDQRTLFTKALPRVMTRQQAGDLFGSEPGFEKLVAPVEIDHRQMSRRTWAIYATKKEALAALSNLNGKLVRLSRRFWMQSCRQL